MTIRIIHLDCHDNQDYSSRMSYYLRQVKLGELLKQKSFFLFGPRGTGKTSLIQKQLQNYKLYDLLDARTYSRLLKNPHIIEEENKTNTNQIIVIDEIQKHPPLLDEVHRCINNYNWTFLLTGSSARKLKRGAANLLAGRAWQAELFSLCYKEIPDFNLLKYINRGGLPFVYTSQNYKEELESYTSLYLKEEIQAESLTRKLPSFSHFLDAMALSNGEEINLEKFANDCGVSPKTIRNYIEILEDTLICFSLPAFRKTKKRKAISRQKEFFFDIGLVNHLCNRGEIKNKSELFGKAFEHFIILETRAYLSYQRKRKKMFFWRSKSQYEVDLIIDQDLAIEIKSSTQVNDRDLKGLRALKEEGLIKKFILVSLDEEKRVTSDDIHILPWQDFLNSLWNDKWL